MPQIVSPDFNEKFTNTLIEKLYEPQKVFWKLRLDHLIEVNRALHLAPQDRPYGIHYQGTNWQPYTEVLYEKAYSIVYLFPHAEFAPMEPELQETVQQLNTLEDEKYEVTRFLSGLVLFPAPLKIYEKILGKQLYAMCATTHFPDTVHMTEGLWDSNTNKALMTYVDHHGYVIKAMHKRLLINLITQDQTRQ